MIFKPDLQNERKRNYIFMNVVELLKKLYMKIIGKFDLLKFMKKAKILFD